MVLSARPDVLEYHQGDILYSSLRPRPGVLERATRRLLRNLDADQGGPVADTFRNPQEGPQGLGDAQEPNSSPGDALCVTAQVLGFAGKIGSGKSTVSGIVATMLGWQRASFGQFLRDEAARIGLDGSSREALEALGQGFIAGGWTEFCKKVLGAAHWVAGNNLVVDGIRHVEAVETIRKLTAPSNVALVFIKTPEALRESRLVARGFGERASALDSHATESQVLDILPKYAAYTLDGSLPPEECAAHVITWLQSQP